MFGKIFVFVAVDGIWIFDKGSGKVQFGMEGGAEVYRHRVLADVFFDYIIFHSQFFLGRMGAFKGSKD